MSVLVLPGDPDEFLPRHISGRLIGDPYENRPAPQRVRAEVVSVEPIIDLVALEAEEAEFVERAFRAAQLLSAVAAYEGAQGLASTIVPVPRYALDVCDEGHLHREPILPGVPG